MAIACGEPPQLTAAFPELAHCRYRTAQIDAGPQLLQGEKGIAKANSSSSIEVSRNGSRIQDELNFSNRLVRTSMPGGVAGARPTSVPFADQERARNEKTAGSRSGIVTCALRQPATRSLRVQPSASVRPQLTDSRVSAPSEASSAASSAALR